MPPENRVGHRNRGFSDDRRSGQEDGRAGGLAGLQIAMRLRRLGQRVGLVDFDLDHTLEDHVEQLVGTRHQLKLCFNCCQVCESANDRDDTATLMSRPSIFSSSLRTLAASATASKR